VNQSCTITNREATMPYATNDGVRIYYETEGSGPPLVLHGGLSGSLNDWRDFGYVDALRDDYRLILIDPRGHGQSDKPHDPIAYAYHLFVGDVVAVLDDLGVATAHFWGYSMGALVGFAVGQYAPARFRSLILGGQHPYAQDAQAFRQRAVTTRTGGPAGVVAMWEQTGVSWPETLRARLLLNDVEALAAVWVAIGEAPGCGANLRDVSLPMLIYCGDRDDSYALAQAAAAEAQQATFVTLSGLNHGEATCSDLIIPHIRAFLAGLGGTSAPNDR
jgi:pimeloyl-ACP methyl ester carboxylesterase